MRKFGFLLLLLLATQFASAQRIVSSDVLLVKDSIRLNGVWYTSLSGGASTATGVTTTLQNGVVGINAQLEFESIRAAILTNSKYYELQDDPTVANKDQATLAVDPLFATFLATLKPGDIFHNSVDNVIYRVVDENQPIIGILKATTLTEAEVDAFVSDNGFLTVEVDGDITNELQDPTLVGNNLGMTNTAVVVDLSGYLDNTNLDEAAVDAFVANNGYLTVEVDGSIFNELSTITTAATAPSTPKSGDIWIDTSTSTAKVWDGGSWVIIAPAPDGTGTDDQTANEVNIVKNGGITGDNVQEESEINRTITNDLNSLTGLPPNSTDMGTYSGDIITDGSDLKVVTQQLETSIEGKQNIVYFNAHDDILNASLNVGDVAITKGFSSAGDGGGAKFYVQALGVTGYVTDSIAVIPVAGGYAVMKTNESVRSFGGIYSSNLEKNINYYVANNNRNINLKNDTILFDKTIMASCMNLSIRNATFLYSDSIVTFSRMLDMSIEQNFTLNNVTIDGQWDTYNTPLGSLVGNLSNFAASGSAQISNDTIYLNSGTSEVRYNYNYTATETYHVKIFADITSGTVTFGDNSGSVHQLVQGLNEFDFTIIGGSPERFEVTANSSSTAVISFLEIREVAAKTSIKSMNNINTNSVVLISKKGNKQAGSVIFENVNAYNLPNIFLQIKDNANAGFDIVALHQMNANKVTTAISIAGNHTNIILNNFTGLKARNTGLAGVKFISFFDDVGFIRGNVIVNNAIVKYGGDGSTFFVSGGKRSGVFSNITINRWGYYLDSLNNEVAYQKEGSVHNNRLSTVGGSVLAKIDPVKYNTSQLVEFTNISITETNDTINLFQPIIYNANGSVNVQVDNMNADIGAFKWGEQEALISGGSGGSQSGRMIIRNSVFDVSNVPMRLSNSAILSNTVINGKMAYQGYQGDSINFVRLNEYQDSLPEFTSPTGLFAVNASLENVKVFGASVQAGNNTFIDGLELFGSGKINLVRDDASPYNDTINIIIDRLVGNLAFLYRLEDRSDGTQDVNFNLKLTNSLYNIINLDGNDYRKAFSELPRKTESGNFSFNNNIVKIDQNYAYEKVNINGVTQTGIGSFTAAEAAALSPSNSDQIYVTDIGGVFTSIGFWAFENGTWKSVIGSETLTQLANDIDAKSDSVKTLTIVDIDVSAQRITDSLSISNKLFIKNSVTSGIVTSQIINLPDVTTLVGKQQTITITNDSKAGLNEWTYITAFTPSQLNTSGSSFADKYYLHPNETVTLINQGSYWSIASTNHVDVINTPHDFLSGYFGKSSYNSNLGSSWKVSTTTNTAYNSGIADSLLVYQIKDKTPWGGNAILYSSDLDNGNTYWVRLGANITVVKDSIDAPDGSRTAEYVQRDVGNAFRISVFNFPLVTTKQYVFSFYAKPPTDPALSMTAFDLELDDRPNFQIPIDVNATDWKRYEIVFTPDQDEPTSYFFDITMVGDIGDGLFLTDVQLEEGTVASPLKETTTTAATSGDKFVTYIARNGFVNIDELQPVSDDSLFQKAIRFTNVKGNPKTIFFEKDKTVTLPLVFNDGQGLISTSNGILQSNGGDYGAILYSNLSDPLRSTIEFEDYVPTSYQTGIVIEDLNLIPISPARSGINMQDCYFSRIENVVIESVFGGIVDAYDYGIEIGAGTIISQINNVSVDDCKKASVLSASGVLTTIEQCRFFGSPIGIDHSGGVLDVTDTDLERLDSIGIRYVGSQLKMKGVYVESVPNDNTVANAVFDIKQAKLFSLTHSTIGGPSVNDPLTSAISLDSVASAYIVDNRFIQLPVPLSTTARTGFVTYMNNGVGNGTPLVGEDWSTVADSSRITALNNFRYHDASNKKTERNVIPRLDLIEASLLVSKGDSLDFNRVGLNGDIVLNNPTIRSKQQNIHTNSDSANGWAISATRWTQTLGIVDPFGGTSAVRLTVASPVGGGLIRYSTADYDFTAHQGIYTVSFWAKLGTEAFNNSMYSIGVDAGDVGSENTRINIDVNDKTWKRYSTQVVFDGTSANFLDLEWSGGALDVGDYFDIYGFQIEKNQFMGGYISTGATPIISTAPSLDLPEGLILDGDVTIKGTSSGIATKIAGKDVNDVLTDLAIGEGIVIENNVLRSTSKDSLGVLLRYNYEHIDSLVKYATNLSGGEILTLETGGKYKAVHSLKTGETADGFLIKQISTTENVENYFLTSQDFSNTSRWLRTGATWSGTNNSTIAPDGSKTAMLCAANANNPEFGYANSTSTTFNVGEVWYWSFWFKCSPELIGKTISITFGTIGGNPVDAPVSIITTDQTWRRYELKFTIGTQVTDPNMNIRFFNGILTGETWSMTNMQMSRHTIIEQDYKRTDTNVSQADVIYLKLVNQDVLVFDDIPAYLETNVTKRLQDALDFCASNDIGTLLIKNDLEVDSIAIPDHVTLSGNGRYNTTISISGTVDNGIKMKTSLAQPTGQSIKNITINAVGVIDTIINLGSVFRGEFTSLDVNGSGTNQEIGIYLGVQTTTITLSSLNNLIDHISVNNCKTGLLYEGSILSVVSSSGFGTNDVGIDVISGTIELNTVWCENNRSFGIRINTTQNVSIENAYFESNNTLTDTISINVLAAKVFSIKESMFNSSTNTKTCIRLDNVNIANIEANEVHQGVRFIETTGLTGDVIDIANYASGVPFSLNSNSVNNLSSSNATITSSLFEQTNTYSNQYLIDSVSQVGVFVGTDYNILPRNNTISTSSAWVKSSMTSIQATETFNGNVVDSITLASSFSYLAMGTVFINENDIDLGKYTSQNIYIKTSVAGLTYSWPNSPNAPIAISSDGLWHRYNAWTKFDVLPGGFIPQFLIQGGSIGDVIKISQPQINRGKLASAYVLNNSGGAVTASNPNFVLRSANGITELEGETRITNSGAVGISNVGLDANGALAQFDITPESTTVTDAIDIDFTLAGNDITATTIIDPASDNLSKSVLGLKAMYPTVTPGALSIVAGDMDIVRGTVNQPVVWTTTGQLGDFPMLNSTDIQMLKDVDMNGQAIRIGRFTAVEATALTGSNGDQIYVTTTNGTFDKLGFWGYQEGTWIFLSDRNIKTSVTLDLTSVAANTSSDSSILFPGAIVGEPVVVGTDTMPSEGSWVAWISIAGNVNIRYVNNSASAVDPPSTVITLTIIR